MRPSEELGSLLRPYVAATVVASQLLTYASLLVSQAKWYSLSLRGFEALLLAAAVGVRPLALALACINAVLPLTLGSLAAALAAALLLAAASAKAVAQGPGGPQRAPSMAHVAAALSGLEALLAVASGSPGLLPLSLLRLALLPRLRALCSLLGRSDALLLVLTYPIDVTPLAVADAVAPVLKLRGSPTQVVLGRTLNLLERRGLARLWLVSDVAFVLPLDVRANPNVVIVGATGTGKSRTAMTIARRVLGSAKLVVIDPHGEYGRVCGTVVDVAGGLNALAPVGFSPRNNIDYIVSFFKHAYRIGPRQEYLLREALSLAYEEAGLALDEEVAEERQVDLRPALAYLAHLREPSAYTLTGYLSEFMTYFARGPSIHGLLAAEGCVVFDLSRLPSTEYKQIAAELIARSVLGYVRSQGVAERTRLVLVVDEAHALIPRGRAGARTVLSLVVEARKYGVATIIVTQTPSQVDDLVLANARYKLILPLYEQSEITKLLRGTVFSEPRIQPRVTEVVTGLRRGRVLVLEQEQQVMAEVEVA